MPGRKMPCGRTEALGPFFEASVQNSDIEVSGKGLSLFEVVDRKEGIVGELTAHPGRRNGA